LGSAVAFVLVFIIDLALSILTTGVGFRLFIEEADTRQVARRIAFSKSVFGVIWNVTLDSLNGAPTKTLLI